MTDVFSIPQGNCFYNPPWPVDMHPLFNKYLDSVKSPKSTAFPCDIISIYSIVILTIPAYGPEGFHPPPIHPRVAEELDVAP